MPTAERGCSGYLVEHDGYRLLVDPGYATVLELQKHLPATEVDAVIVSHAHADHYADLNPLLRMRHLSNDRPPALPVYAPRGAVDAVLAMDTDMLLDDFVLNEVTAGDELVVGPFDVATRSLSHFVSNIGIRLSAGAAVLAYTGDGGADPGVVDLASGAALLLAEATYVDDVPEGFRGLLANARQAGEHAARAAVAQLVLTHLWPDSDRDAARQAARETYAGPVAVAVPGLRIELP